MIVINLRETNPYTLRQQLGALLRGERGGIVHSQAGERIVLCHGFADGHIEPPCELNNNDAVVCCYPNIVRNHVPNKIIGDWDGLTYIKIQYGFDVKTCVLYIDNQPIGG